MPSHPQNNASHHTTTPPNNTGILCGEALDEHRGLLADESRLTGTPIGLARPASEAELADILRACHAANTPVTLGSGLTGISGGAVPFHSVAINFGRMNRILGLSHETIRRDKTSEDLWLVRCQPGVLLAELRTALQEKQFDDANTWLDSDRESLEAFKKAPAHTFPVDPTESSAALGGMAACNASGARSFYHGAMRKHVIGIRGVLMDGRTFSLHREEARVNASGQFHISLDDGSILKGTCPQHTMPATKNAAGYWSAPGMDMVDLFIGSEGTLCALTELTLRLTPEPPCTAGVMIFCPDEATALQLVWWLRGDENSVETMNDNAMKHNTPSDAGIDKNIHRQKGAGLLPLSLEFFDANALSMLRAALAENGDREVTPPLPAHFHTALSVEFCGEVPVVNAALLSLHEKLSAQGIANDATWLAMDAAEHARLKSFRHLVPETVNRHIAAIKRNVPTITKLGTDMAVPKDAFEETLAGYHATLAKAKLEYVIFGHIGDCHVHVNILPRSEEEYKRGKELYIHFAEEAVARGGTISAEHGVGRIKTFLMPVMFGEEGIASMRQAKQCFDPKGLLNPGVLLPMLEE